MAFYSTLRQQAALIRLLQAGGSGSLGPPALHRGVRGPERLQTIWHIARSIPCASCSSGTPGGVAVWQLRVGGRGVKWMLGGVPGSHFSIGEPGPQVRSRCAPSLTAADAMRGVEELHDPEAHRHVSVSTELPS